MTDMTDITAPPATSRLSDFPISFFAIVMGLAGLTLAADATERTLALGHIASQVLLYATILVFLTIAAFYGLKAARFPKAIAAEWAHPVRIAFFPTLSISLLLIATAMVPVAPDLARPLWIVGALVQGALTLAVVANWVGHRAFEHGHLTPAWFIPAVGNVVVPVAGVGLGYYEMSWLYFSAGLVFWLILLTLVFNRLIFHDPMPGRLAPTLVILLAPPAVAFIAYVRLTGEVDVFARILLNIGYVFLGVVLTQLGTFRRLPFALSWWALSFPLAALAIASLTFSTAVGSSQHQVIGLALVGLLAIVVIGLIARTFAAIRAHEICRPE